MGNCCSSSSAVAPDVVVPRKRGAKENVAGAVGLTVAAGSAAGEALLAVGQHLPWIAPVAFLIGAVVKAAHDVQVLKGDALKFANFVRTAEGILNDAALAGTLGAAKDAVEQARAALEATLAHLQKLGTLSKFSALLTASSNKDTFLDLQVELGRCMGLVGVAASVSTHSLMAAEYQQGAKLAATLESLGGVESVGQDPAKLALVEKEMAASDRLLMQGIQSVRADVQASGKRVEEALASQFSRADAAADLRHEVMSKQIENLTSLMQTMMAFKAGVTPSSQTANDAMGDSGAGATAGSSDDDGDGSEREAAIAAATTAEAIHEALEAMPVRGDEASRLAKVRELGLDLTDRARLEAIVGDSELEDIIKEAQEGCDVPVAYIGSLTNDKQIFLAASSGERGDTTGTVVPREMTQCQHVIASGDDEFHSHLTYGKNENFDYVDLPKMIQGGYMPPPRDESERMFESLGHVMSGGDPTTRANLGVPVATATSGGIGKFAATLYGEQRSTYASVPIRVDGQTVGTLCVVDHKERSKSNVDYGKMRTLAARAAAVIKQRATESALELPPEGKGGAETGAKENGKAPPPSVAHLTADTFGTFVLDPQRNVAVLLHTSWCGHCPKMLQLWRSLAILQAADHDAKGIHVGVPLPVRFAAFDVTNENPPDEQMCWQVKHVPSLVLSPKGSGGPVAYVGPLDPASVAAWLRERCPELVVPGDFGPNPSPAKQSSRSRPGALPSSLVVSDGQDGGAMIGSIGTPIRVEDMMPHALVTSPARDGGTAVASNGRGGSSSVPAGLSEEQSTALALLQASLASAAAAGTHQLETLRRVGSSTAAAGSAFLKTAGVVMAAHAETYAKALTMLEGADELNDMQSKLIGVAMGMQRDAAAQQLRLLQDIAGSSPAFDSPEFVALLEASALRVSQVASAHIELGVTRARDTLLR